MQAYMNHEVIGALTTDRLREASRARELNHLVAIATSADQIDRRPTGRISREAAKIRWVLTSLWRISRPLTSTGPARVDSPSPKEKDPRPGGSPAVLHLVTRLSRRRIRP